MKVLAFMLVVGALIAAPSAAAQLVAKPKCKTQRCIAASQLKNLKHARYVCNNGANKPKRWACRAVKWLSREYEQTVAPVVRYTSSYGYSGLTSIRWAVAFCESGGDPHNRHNPKYRGKWQFDQSTWDKFAPAGWAGRDPADAPESIQDQAALNVTYDAWPHC